MMVVVSAADCLRQILDIRELAALRCGGEIVRKRGELAGRRCVALRCRGLSGGFEICGDLLRDLLVLAGIVLLELLQRAQYLRERRDLAVVRNGRRCDTAHTRVVLGGHASVLEGGIEDILDVVGRRKIVDGTGTHAFLIGTWSAT